VVAEDGEQAISHAWTPATWERRDHWRGGRAQALQRNWLRHQSPDCGSYFDIRDPAAAASGSGLPAI